MTTLLALAGCFSDAPFEQPPAEPVEPPIERVEPTPEPDIEVPPRTVVKVTGRVLDSKGRPLRSVMVRAGELAFTDADGRYEAEATVDPDHPLTIIAELLDTSPCDDPGNCGISTSSEMVADAIALEALMAKGTVGQSTFQHDFRLERPRMVTVVPRVQGTGWPLRLSCLDPQRPERVLYCQTKGSIAVKCKCPPGDAVLRLYQTEIEVNVPAAATRVEVDLRSYGGLAGRIVHDGEPAFGYLVLALDALGDIHTEDVEGDFDFGPIPIRPVHLVYVTHEQRFDLGVYTPGSPTTQLGDLEVPKWDPPRE